VRGDRNLRLVAGEEPGPEAVYTDRAPVRGDAQLERRARVEVPDLGGVDAVPVRGLARGEHVEDRGHRAAAAVLGDVAEGLAEMAALWVWLEPESGDDGLRVAHRLGAAAGAATPRRASSSVTRRARRALQREPARRCT